MTISPPSNTSYGTGAKQTMSAQESAREREELFRRAAFFKTPEGQAVQAELIERSRREAAAYKEICASLDEDAKEDEGSSKHKKHGKLFAKHSAKKSTGGLLGLMSKITKKG